MGNAGTDPPRPRMPQEIRDLFTHGRQATILYAAAEHRLFDAIGRVGKTAKQLSSKLHLDARAVAILLDALTAMGVLRKKGTRYTNTFATRRHFCSDSHHSILASLQHANNLNKTWSHLDEVLRTGKAVGTQPRSGKDAARRITIFTRAMYNTGYGAGTALPDMVDLSRCRNLIDIGGGPGHFSYHLCTRYPDLSATVYDLPATIRETRKYLKQYGLGKRMRALAGDYKAGEIPGPFDAALLSHIIHASGEEENRQLMGKVFRCLNAGGILILRDFLLYEGKTSPKNAAVFAVNMLLNTRNGRTYTFGEVRRWMREAGFHRIKRRGKLDLGDASVMTALKPDLQAFRPNDV